MADLTNLFAKVNILRYGKGSRGSHKIVKTCSFVFVMILTLFNCIFGVYC